MKKLLLIIVLGVLCLHSHAEAQQEPREYNKIQILEDCYGEIRANMFKDACRIAGYTKVAVLDKIENQSVGTFMSALSEDIIEDEESSKNRGYLCEVLRKSDKP